MVPLGGGRIYAFLLSLHGLVRGRDPELGRDADTGGQVTYVLELARALGRHPSVERVDLLTRLIEDPAVSPDYAVPDEPLGPKARIVRLPFGPKRYLRKELLWRRLDPVVDRCAEYLRRQERLPDLIHSHYADAGYVGVRLSQLLGLPLVHTGHSLGRVKRRRLLAAGGQEAAIDRQFSFERRISAEEEVLAHASLVLASTRQEVEEQWALYENFDPRRIVVVPPGADVSRFTPPPLFGSEKRAEALLDRYLREPRKPLILAVCRPVEQKNAGRLLRAYGEDPELRRMANLAVVSGSRDDVRAAPEEQRRVFTEFLLDVDRHDLAGKVAFPKRHSCEDVPELYRLAARRRGVFVDVALTEPFGLTLLEAAASGLPVVATSDGGPRDIVEGCRNGLLVDPLDTEAVAAALKTVLSAPRVQWRRWSRGGIAGVSRLYTWERHVAKCLRLEERLVRRERKQARRRIADARDPSRPLLRPFRSVLVSDVDDTLVGDDGSLRELLAWLRRHRQEVLFGIATGRVLELALAALGRWRIPLPDVLITGVGTEIHYGPTLAPDAGWTRHIRFRWRREAVEEALRGSPGLVPQSAEQQSPWKVSYDVAKEGGPRLEEVERTLRGRGLEARVVLSQGTRLDVVPRRASKGLAIRHLSLTRGVPLDEFLVAGDSGNDVEMLVGDTLAVVVANHSPELDALKGSGRVYFARRPFAGGILEGISHYGFAAARMDAAPPASVPEPACWPS